MTIQYERNIYFWCMTIRFTSLLQTLDINGDGLLDYDEIKQFLDSSGDTTAVKKVLREYFDNHLDADTLGEIDFMSFLDLVNSITVDNNYEDDSGTTVQRQNSGLLSGKKTVEILRKLSLETILNNQLF